MSQKQVGDSVPHYVPWISEEGQPWSLSLREVADIRDNFLCNLCKCFPYELVAESFFLQLEKLTRANNELSKKLAVTEGKLEVVSSSTCIYFHTPWSQHVFMAASLSSFISKMSMQSSCIAFLTLLIAMQYEKGSGILSSILGKTEDLFMASAIANVSEQAFTRATPRAKPKRKASTASKRKKPVASFR